ncbi:TetR/AcrR family transcriptional regulator [Xenophilus sp. Marseille-Q4582]|uniref:TetR/AcrR family transcriptional regulator n=1 Tax=Xenophilus sp. Marseille-Q4582 TaxID=2866600 RepID=UPI001CE3C310|nr:TetR/AcrR family transcriptional regulator [Xenophilus sp. Marseille-Q4582]
MADLTPDRPLRTDAQLRRTALLDAAAAVFSEHGVNAPLELVIERAGVGRATLYRNFPDRGALMQALMGRNLDRIEQEAQRLAGHEEGLFELLVYMAQRIADSAPITDYWRAIDREHPLVREAQARLGRMVRPLIERAVHAGRCRADFAESDFVLAVGMVGALLRGHTLQQRRRMGRRALELLLDGLRVREPAP